MKAQNTASTNTGNKIAKTTAAVATATLVGTTISVAAPSLAIAEESGQSPAGTPVATQQQESVPAAPATANQAEDALNGANQVLNDAKADYDAAQGVAAVGCEALLRLLLRGEHHRGLAELLDEERGRAFRTEVAEEHATRVDSFLPGPFERAHRVVLVLYRDGAVYDACHFRLLELGHDGREALLG